MEKLDINGNTNENRKMCFICPSTADLCCTNCQSVWFCCAEHGSKHGDGQICYPYRVTYQDGMGRQLRAARHILAGEVIFRDSPLVVGPNAEGQPLCLACQSAIDTTYVCVKCGYPMCDIECADNPIHKPECDILSNGPRPVFEQDKANEEAYHCILPLRLLLKDDSDPARKLMEGLMDHEEDRLGNDYWNTAQDLVVDHLINKCGQKQFSVDQVNRAVGVLEVNCWEFQSFVTCGNRGLFPLLALVNHNCGPNTRNIWMTEPPFTNTTIACVDIKEGEEITNSYLNFLTCGIARRKMIKDGWYFECECSRCRDPTELGSHVNTLLCTKCTNGLLLSMDPLEFRCDWQCSMSRSEDDPCGHIENHETVATLVQRFLNKVTYLVQEKRYSVKDWLSFEAAAKCHFHPQHEVMCEISKWVIHILCRGPQGVQIGNFPRYLVETKLRLATNYLNVLDILDPGTSRSRAKVLYEILECQIHITQTDFQDNKIDLQALRHIMSGYETRIQEVLSIFDQLGTITGFEAMVYNSARVLGDSCKELSKTTRENQYNET